MSGVKYTTLCERLKRGYSAEEAIAFHPRIPPSVIEFDDASDYEDWDGMTSEELYKIYRQWCIKHEYAPESNVHFTRSIKQVHPNIRVVPTRLKVYGDIAYKRVVRVDTYK